MSERLAKEACVKYPRTPHLPWSPGSTCDDRRMSEEQAQNLLRQDVVVTAKMDGENCSMYRHAIHARSLTSSSTKDRDWVKNLWSSIKLDIPKGWRLCGENLFARHSLGYTNLPGFFLLFSVWDDSNICLSWKETLEWACLLGLPTVPTLYEGLWRGEESTLNELQKAALLADEGVHEGYVVRSSDKFPFDQFQNRVAKYVRAGHVSPDTGHWRRRAVVPNVLTPS